MYRIVRPRTWPSFAGVGNIIKNEVLFRIRVHPLSTVGALPPAKLRALVRQARQYSFEFPGRSNRRSFFCQRCQKRYG